MKIRNRLFAGTLLTVGMLAVAAGERVDENLLLGNSFSPVRLGKTITAAYGWCIVDQPYILEYQRNPKRQDRLFRTELMHMDYTKDGFSFRFSDKEYPGADKHAFIVSNFFNSNNTSVPANRYRVTGKVAVRNGSLILPGGKKLEPKPEFQTFDYTIPDFTSSFCFHPRKNQELIFQTVSIRPEYNVKAGGTIDLPDGGKLEKMLVPENMDQNEKNGALAWRGWLWKLTGILLPLEYGEGGKNALTLKKGPLPSGSWNLDIGKEGGTLEYSSSEFILPALFDYLHLTKFRHISKDMITIPAPDAQMVLPKTHLTRQSRYALASVSDFLSGGKYNGLLWDCGKMMATNWYSNGETALAHPLDSILPMYEFLEKHPEYYMLEAHGERQQWVKCPYLMTPCLSNENVMKIMQDRYAEWGRQYDYAKLIPWGVGDRPDLCHCDKCRAEIKSLSKTDYILEKVNQFAKHVPNKEVMMSAYLETFSPPKQTKPEKNVLVSLCFPDYNMPCTAHIDCELNRPALESLKEWSRLVGPERLIVTLYEEERPVHALKLLEYFNRYAKGGVWQFPAMYNYIPEFAYTLARWNLGMDAHKALEEFNNAYYGKGGKYVTQIYDEVEEFCRNYKHSPAEIKKKAWVNVMTWVPGRVSVLNREILDRVYALFDKALDETKDEGAIIRLHLLYEKLKFLRADLEKYRRASIENESELKTFALRFADFIRACAYISEYGKFPYTWIEKEVLWCCSPVEFVKMVAGVEFPSNGGKWTRSETVKAFLANPVKTLTVQPQRIPGGLYFSPSNMNGGRPPHYYDYKCDKKFARFIRRPSDPNACAIKLDFSLTKVPKGAAILSMEGLDDDKPGTSTFRISVNGTEIFNGANTFRENTWTRMNLVIPAGLLKARDNRIEIRDTVPERKSSAKPAKQEGMFYAVEEIDFTYGWIGFSGIEILMPEDEMAKFMNGENSVWSKISWFVAKPMGTVDGEKGVLKLRSIGAPYTGMSFPSRITVNPEDSFKFSVTASGKGSISVGFWDYETNKKYIGDRVATFQLSAEKQTFVQHVTAGKKTASIVLFISAGKNAEADISGYSVIPVTALRLQPSAIPGGWRFSPNLMSGGISPHYYDYQCEKMFARFIARPVFGDKSRITLVLELGEANSGPALLSVTGLDDDKKDASSFNVLVNGKTLFSGKNTFDEHLWKPMTLTIPAGWLKAGNNLIELVNTTQEDKNTPRKMFQGGVYTEVKEYDSQYGWIGIAGIDVIMLNDEYRKFLEKKKSSWHVISWDIVAKPYGVVERIDGKIRLISKGAKSTGFEAASIVTGPNAPIVIKVSAAGKGKLSVGYWSYDRNGKIFYPGTDNKALDMSAEKQEYTLNLPTTSKTEKVLFYVSVPAGSSATIYHFEIFTTPPEQGELK